MNPYALTVLVILSPIALWLYVYFGCHAYFWTRYLFLMKLAKGEINGKKTEKE